MPLSLAATIVKLYITLSMTDINIFKFEGKPIEKLIDVVSKGIGTLYRPKSIRKEAEAKAYKIEIIERAKSKALSEGQQIEIDTLTRIEEKIIAQEQKRLNNIDRVVIVAAEDIKDSPSVSEEPVNGDWITRFFNIVEDVSDEEMQIIWGSILSGEVKRPKTYSLRTLEFLKNISKEEAQLFLKVAGLSLFGDEKNFVFNPENGAYLKESYQISFTDILQLKELGLLNSQPDLIFQISKPIEGGNVFLIYQKKAIIIELKSGAPELKLPILIFTQIGMELLNLVKKEVDMEYLKHIKNYLKSEYVSVKIGDIVEKDSKSAKIVNVQEIPDLNYK
jgi:hypothetical protein